MTKKKTKVEKIEKISKLITDGKLDKALELADVEDAEGLFEIGALFGQKGVHDVAEKIFSRVIQLNPNLAEAWYNKGITLGNLGKYDEEIKCYDEAIKINPNYDKAWSNKGVALGNLGKYDEEIKCYDEAIKINPNLADAWYNKGVALGNLGKYDEEIKCYDEAIKINPNYDKAWSNKGVALGNLGKYDEEIKCYDEAIKINPNLADAWYNKGVALGNLGKYDKSIKCYDEAIKINSNYAEAYGNKGIAFLNIRKYDDARVELRKAKKLFSKRRKENDAKKAYKLELLAENASELLSKLKPLDEQFMDCLNSQSLSELKNKSLEVSKDIKSIVEEFSKIELPDDAIRLLKSKEICFTALSSSLKFEEVDLGILRDTEDIFDDWKLGTFATAVSFLAAFIRALNRYNSFGEIPKEAEEQLLQALRTSYVLDGKLTEEITGKIKGEPYVAKPTGIEKAPKIIPIPIPNIGKDCLRICLVQLDFLLTKKFPYQLKMKKDVKGKILKALEVAKQEEVDIICFPEFSFGKEFIAEVKKYKDMIIVGGSFYDNSFNICPVIIGGEVCPVYKIHPSPYLESEIAPGKGMQPGKDIKIFRTNDGKLQFGVLICLDYLEEGYRLCQYQNKGKKGVNFIFNPSFNPDPKRFQEVASLDCMNHHVDLIQTNVKKYGGTCVIGVEHKDIIERLINEGYRSRDNIKYKLCEAYGEMMIIVDLSLKGVEVPTPLGAKPRIKIIGRYRYENRCWQK